MNNITLLIINKSLMLLFLFCVKVPETVVFQIKDLDTNLSIVFFYIN